MSFQTDWLVNLTLSALIITGGLGFMVWFDLATKARNQSGRRTLRFHTKVVLWLTAAILLFGTVTSLLTEFDNPATIGSLPLGEKILVSFFQTVSMRTAGFALTGLYSSPTCNALCLYPPDVFRWGTRWYSRRDEDHHLLGFDPLSAQGIAGIATYQPR